MRIGFLVTMLFLATACASTQVATTKRPAPDMSLKRVWDRLGEPPQTQVIANKEDGKDSCHQPWKGFIPYYRVFERDTQRLDEGFADEAEYPRQQQRWLQAFPSNQNREVDVRIHR